jgi:rhodanese-related sulfurtransferase
LAFIEPAVVDISVADFHDRIQRADDRLLLLDVRNEEEFNTQRIQSPYTPETLNLPYVVFIEAEEEALAQIPAGREIIVVCVRGQASLFVTEILCRQGHVAYNLAGGILAWNNYLMVIGN